MVVKGGELLCRAWGIALLFLELESSNLITKVDIHKTAVVASCFHVLGLCGALPLLDNTIHKENGKLSHHWARPGTSLMRLTCGTPITRENTMSDLIAE